MAKGLWLIFLKMNFETQLEYETKVMTINGAKYKKYISILWEKAKIKCHCPLENERKNMLKVYSYDYHLTP